MATKKLGKQTVKFATPPVISSTYSIVGPKEGEGPLGEYFDLVLEDEFWGEKTWEKTESKIVKECIAGCLGQEPVSNEDVDFLLSGDLLNQCVSSSFGIRERSIPYFGLFGACSTFVESLALGSMLIDGQMADTTIGSTSSHFCSAEKQFRFPLELGTQRPPTSQWTVTGAGAALLKAGGTGPKITHATIGKIVDMGIKDANNMGAAMAPAAIDTLFQHFQDTGRTPIGWLCASITLLARFLIATSKSLRGSTLEELTVPSPIYSEDVTRPSLSRVRRYTVSFESEKKSALR